MEFPYLGEQCSRTDCRTLDFLPIRCSGCQKIFCGTHFRYEQHNCNSPPTDNQVPICPLCNTPVAIKHNQSPDYAVSEHIDRNCTPPGDGQKVYKNACSMIGCKKREIMELKCEGCGLNHCLKHRHPVDHKCSSNGVKNPTAANYHNHNRSLTTTMVNGTATATATSKTDQILNSFTRKSANLMENLRTNVINPISTGARNLSNNYSSSSSNASSSLSSTAVRTNQQQQQSHTPAISAIQGDLSEEEALNLAIMESLQSQSRTTTVVNNTQSNSSSGNNNNSANNQKCSVS